MDSRLPTFLLVLGLSLVGVTVVYGIAQSVTETITQTTCLARGHPSSFVTWDFHRYCIKRVNQTDVVTPLTPVTP